MVEDNRDQRSSNSDCQQLDHGEEISETSPLLPTTPSTRRANVALLLLIGLFISLLVVILNVGIFFSNIDYYLDESIKLDSFDFYGLNYHIQGVLDVNYDAIDNSNNNINNPIINTFLKIIGSIIGLISINQDLSNPTRFFVKPAILDVDPLHVMNSTLSQPIYLDFHNNRSNIIDLYCSSLPIPYNVVKLMDYMDSIPDEEILLDVIGYFSGYIEHKLVQIPIKNYRFAKKISVTKSQIIPKISLQSFKIRENNQGHIQVLNEITIENGVNSALNLEIEQIEWQVYIKDCQNYTSIGNWKSNPFEIVSGQDIEVEIYGIIDSIPDTLHDVCKQTQKTSINRLIQNVIDTDELEFRIKAIQSKSLPQWVIDSMELNINFPVESNNINNSSPPLNFKSMNRFNLEIDDNTINFDGGIQFDNPYHINFNSSIKQLTSEIYYQHQKILNVTIDDAGIINTFQLLDVSYESCIQIDRSDIMPTLNRDDLITIKMVISEIDLQLSIDQIVLKDIQLQREVTIGELEGIYDYYHDKYRYNTSDVPFNATINQIQYITSSPNSLEISSEVGVNPKNYSIKIPHDIIVGLSKKNHNLTTITTKGISISGDNANATIESIITIGPLNTKSKIELEMMASHIISGYNTSIDINSITSDNAMIHNLLKPLNVSSVDFPRFDNPFLIDNTIHLFGSTVELTLYNPIGNCNLYVDIYQATAKYEDVILGELESPQTLIITPGVYKSPKLPIRINNNLGMDILQKYLNGDLPIELVSLFLIKVDMFSSELFYNGHGIKSNVRW